MGRKRSRLLAGLAVKDGFTRHPFDIENGVRTSGLIPGRHLKSGHSNDRHATSYYGIAPSLFASLVQRWRRSKPAAPMAQTTFVDIGAGMGRAMLLAAEMPFREVIGIELNPALVRIARRNMTAWRKMERARTAMRLVCGDASDFEFPAGPCVVFLFNPFGPVVLRSLLRKIARSFSKRAGELDVLYVNNEQDFVLERQRGMVRLFHGRVKRSPVDDIAEQKILNNQPDGEYATGNYEDCSIWRWVGRSDHKSQSGR